MLKTIVRIITVCMVLGLVTYYVRARGSVSYQAMAAYDAGDYAKALPLFKKWAAQPDVRKSTQLSQRVMSYIIDIEQHLAPPATQAKAWLSSADQTSEQSRLMKQALDFAMKTKTNPADPPMGADRVPHEPMKPGEVREIAIKQLGNFEFDPNTDAKVPPDVAALEGAHLRLTGYMIPQDQTDKIENFALVPSLVSCCFGLPPGVQHMIWCHTAPGKGADFSVDEIIVEGVLHIRVKREMNFTSSIFEFDVASVRAKDE